jgi:Spy/CpxP family protein refolding chaperone
MRISFLSIVLLGSTVFSGDGLADAPLKTTLGLDIEQARQVDEIQSAHRRQYAAKRGEHNREARALRRARTANDSEQIAIQEEKVAQLKVELREIKASEDAAIQKLLTPEQSEKFAAYIEKRNAMVGSSRRMSEFPLKRAALRRL